MQKFSLELLFHIVGIGSASGLALRDNSLFIISDNSSFLYEYRIPEKELGRIPLFENAQENTPKKDKADLEAITFRGNTLHLFGSGSTAKRNRLYTYNVKSKRAWTEDLTAHYDRLKRSAAISDEDFNIEGAAFYNDQWLLFQRGNGAQSRNGIFIVDEHEEAKPVFRTLSLPKIQNIEAAFTDATLVNGKIYFLAAVENTASTYEDGEVLGTFYGIIDPLTFEIEQTALISEKNKFEGICFYRESETEISFLLCEDNDTDSLQSTIYTLNLNK